MLTVRSIPVVLAASCVLLGATTKTLGQTSHRAELARLAIKDLETSFHEALTSGDYDLMLGLWAEGAVYTNPVGTFVGPTEITNFLASTPAWGQVTSLSSNYKTLSNIGGEAADFVFECVIVDVSGQDPLTTPLSLIPFGSQNPSVEIVQHLNATCTAVRNGTKWQFGSFVGAPGPILL